MFAKFISLIIIFFVMYVLSIFFFPDIADQYGNKDINTKIRNIKDMSLQFASGSDSAASIADKIRDVSKGIAETTKEKFVSGSEITNTLIDTGKVFIDETKQTFEHSEQVITEKTEQAKRAAESVQKAYEATQQAKQDLNNLTNFSGSIQTAVSGSIR